MLLQPLVPVLDRIAAAVRDGLSAWPKTLPPWLFYDSAGSRLFDQITELPEYYLTRIERSIFEAHAGAILERASAGKRLRIIELGAGSAAKTTVILKAAAGRQTQVVYEPIDVSDSALEAACERIKLEVPEVRVAPRVMDYTHDFELDAAQAGEQRLVLYIGSSIGNFEPDEAIALLRRVQGRLDPGDGMLLGVDLAKDEATLLAAYDDAEGVTAAFNLNLLHRLNRELDADFDLGAFAHRAVWNARKSRIEMHLESLGRQMVRIASLDLEVAFDEEETIHTENSYKFPPGAAENMISAAGFVPTATWTDDRTQFAVVLGRKS